jgi:hypothetical protein
LDLPLIVAVRFGFTCKIIGEELRAHFKPLEWIPQKITSLNTNSILLVIRSTKKVSCYYYSTENETTVSCSEPNY